ncbi:MULTISPECIES: ABC transporter permease subunit [Streptosporangium]|uniref:ABC-type transport system involved in multi-copper enzyme maturation permease subunit n=1 Tax=Streptosporangium brasiliense TaxID=47480 RepID=A0ABT9RL96_9ACTN|nr:ABC transporter permease subunit [Streptosporangium brasiliense]MDP9869617.1 ABC-type transport system involved in multi-copper enzyme maturation permease subunit [Streptosporangium brasiliense]
MTAGTTTPYRSDLRAGRDGMAQLVRAEWTKFRTVRGWVLGMVAAALVTVLLGLLTASGSHTSCSKGPVEVACPTPPLGPDGQAVSDKFYFVHRQLEGDGGITVRVTSMTGQIRLADLTPGVRRVVPGVVPWAKAGVIIKESTRQGSPYAAVMVTGEHGVRMQHNYVHDTAGRPGGVSARSPRWLRLVRSGDTFTGYESADGRRWTRVGTVRLAGLPSTVRIGLFTASPGDLTVTQGDFGGTIAAARFAEATAVFDQVGLEGRTSGGAWSRDDIGVTTELDGSSHHPGGSEQSGGRFTVTGVGDIGPDEEGRSIENTLSGALAGLIVVIVVAVLFITAEYRRGLIRTTLLAGPRRGRTLAAKAVVVAAVTFVAGLAAAAASVAIGTRILRANGNYVLPVSALTEVRVVAGFAALLAVAAVFALALGALFRRSAPAVTAAIAMIVLPHILATASVLPTGVAQWLLRLTPAAGFAIQQSIPEYSHVLGNYVPQAGYYPLAPWAGLAVLCGYAALALGLAVFRFRRRDA